MAPSTTIPAGCAGQLEVGVAFEGSGAGAYVRLVNTSEFYPDKFVSLPMQYGSERKLFPVLGGGRGCTSLFKGLSPFTRDLAAKWSSVLARFPGERLR